MLTLATRMIVSVSSFDFRLQCAGVNDLNSGFIMECDTWKSDYKQLELQKEN